MTDHKDPTPNDAPADAVGRVFPGATGSMHFRKDDHHAADLLVAALGIGPSLRIGDGIRAIAAELHFLIDSFINGDGSDVHADVTWEALDNMEERLRVLAEVADRLHAQRRAEEHPQ